MWQMYRCNSVQCTVYSVIKGSPIKGQVFFDNCSLVNRSGKYEMKGFVGVTDNDWFAFFSHQPILDEVSFLPKTARQKEGG